ncbi:MAG TPA: sigma factor [Phycisphaerales bacterium]|nr:sigma factor [Phycisphaerales bacterium]
MDDTAGTTERSDEELVRRANAGEARAFEMLYERYCDWAVRTARRFTGDWASANDVMQETFMYLLGKFPGFELRAKMKTVLYPVIRNTALAMKGKY